MVSPSNKQFIAPKMKAKSNNFTFFTFNLKSFVKVIYCKFQQFGQNNDDTSQCDLVTLDFKK